LRDNTEEDQDQDRDNNGNNNSFYIEGGGTKGIKLDIKLGDIVSLSSPDNPELDKKTFLVEYISDNRVSIINILTLQEISIGIDENKKLREKTLVGWNLLSRQDENGYANLYGLLPNKWVNVYFKGDIPQIITGKITNLEEDMIEITPLDNTDPFYIDFEYKGLPEDLVLKIELREEPFIETQLKTKRIDLDNDDGKTNEPTIEYLETGEAIFNIPEAIDGDEDIIEIDDGDDIQEEEYMMYAEIPENEKRYGIQIQTTELLDKMLEAIPLFKRTPRVLQNIHNLIERYKQLRKNIYIFDANGFVLSKKAKIYKSIVEEFTKVNQKLSWILPVMNAPKKIYYTEDSPIIDDLPGDIQILNFADALKEQEETYEKSVNVKDSQTLYEQYLQQNTEYQKPFITRELPPPLCQSVNTKYDFLMNNETESTDKLSVSVANTSDPKEMKIAHYPFFVQRVLDSSKYIIDTTEENGRKESLFKATVGDCVNINSIVILPEIVSHYSRIDLPTTNILTRVELSLTPFYLFNFLKPSRYSSVEDVKGGDDFLNNLQQKGEFFHYKMLSSSSLSLSSQLDKIIPDNEKIFSHLFNQLTNKLSVFETIRLAEPFLIYLDNIDYTIYSGITEILSQKIEKYIRQYNKNKGIYKKLSGKKQTAVHFNVIKELIQSKDTETTSEFKELFNSIYNEFETKMTSSEMLVKINQTDTGHLFYSMITYILFFLITPDKLMDTIKEADITADMGEKDEMIHKTIAKIYSSVAELEKDDGKEIFYDAELDDTPYDVFKKYKKEQNKYTDKDFREYLKQSLIELHNCPPNQVEQYMDTMMNGKKKVKQGEYAVLVEIPNLFKQYKMVQLTEEEKKQIKLEGDLKKRFTYYKRDKSGRWILDDSIQDEKGTLLENRVNVVKQNRKNPEISGAKGTNKTIEQKKQIDDTIYKSIGEKMGQLREKMESVKKTLSIKRVLGDSKLNKKYALGDDIKEFKNKIISPFVKIRQYIFAESDFSRKQQYIVRFYTKFCRDADINEDRYWGYCRETDVKLFPRSLYELAVAFINHNYSEKLDELIFKIGEQSTDGDAVIDKYTGYVLKRNDTSNDEGYDEGGRKIISNAIIEKDTIDVILKEMNRLKGKNFNNETATKIYKVFTLLKMKTGVKDESEEIETFVMNQSVKFLCNSSKLPDECVFNENIFLSLKDFEKEEKIKMSKIKNYKKQNYITYMNRNIISMTIAFFLVAVQTAIPGIKPQKTYPQCVYSYNGFPLTSQNDISGINFLSCIVKSSANDTILTNKTENTELWESITRGYKVEELIKNIVDILNLIAVDVETRDVYINQLYDKKKDYLLLSTDKNPNEYHEQTKKWSLFLPPIVAFSVIKTIKNFDPDYYSHLNKMIVNGNKTQHGLLDMYKSKMKQMTFGVIERIKRIIKASHNVNLLSQSFIQNACCNENNIHNPILYFVEKDAEIRNYIVAINKYYHEYYAKFMVKSPLLFFSNRNKTHYRNDFQHQKYTKEHIYSAYIHYCNYDNDLPVEDDLKDICNKKPNDYDSSMTLKEKIALLEDNKIIYNEDLQIHRLMGKIHNRNLITLPTKREHSILERFVVFLNQESKMSGELKSLLLKIVDGQCKTKRSVVPIDDVDNGENAKLLDLIDYLDVQNGEKYNTILRFFKNYGKYTKTSKEIVFLQKTKSGKKIVGKTTDSNYQFVKNSIKEMTQIYPNYIINNSVATPLKIFEHWEFSTNHSSKLTANFNNFYSELNPFLDNEDDVLHSFLNYCCLNLAHYNTFIELLPIYSNIELNGKKCHNLLNATSIDLLLKYIWYSVLEDYITISDENKFQMKQKENEIQKNERRAMDDEDVALSVNNSALIEGADLEDIYNDLSPGMSRNELLMFKPRVAQLLRGFLMMQGEIVKATDYDYETIKNESFNISEREKNRLISNIGNKNDFEKNVDKLHRKLKLGDYYVGKDFHKDLYILERKKAMGKGGNVFDMEEDNDDEGIPLMDKTMDDDEIEDVGNPQYDEDDRYEDEFGEVRLEDD
jgi:hypothetical protein